MRVDELGESRLLAQTKRRGVTPFVTLQKFLLARVQQNRRAPFASTICDGVIFTPLQHQLQLSPGVSMRLRAADCFHR